MPGFFSLLRRDFRTALIVTKRPPGTVTEIWRLKYWMHGRGHGKKDGKRERESGRGRERKGKRKVEGKKEGKGEEEKE